MKDFNLLVEHISLIHDELQAQAANAVNQALTIRNWLIGYYIVEYEQNGLDRAEYGRKLLNNLESKLKDTGLKNMTARRFRDYRTFYLYYPQIRRTLSAIFNDSLKWRTLSADLKQLTFQGTESTELKKQTTYNSDTGLLVPPQKLITRLSYSHFELLLKLDDKLKRTFYEIECIKGIWSVRELKRQIASLYYERSGLSAKPQKLSKLVHKNTSPQKATDIIKNIYAFEFLDLKIKDVVEESDLETSLLDHLQDFIIELGNGFCFEARQKRILIGEKYYFIDIVFYHRILKCHVLVDLKVGEFDHGDIGQLNTYLNFFKEDICEENDNAPVGILLVADKDHALVKYATAGIDENLFVQQYLVQLPSKEQLEKYIDNELKNLL